MSNHSANQIDSYDDDDYVLDARDMLAPEPVAADMATLAAEDDAILELDAAMVVEDVPQDLSRVERRLSVRAFNYWASLLGGRQFPSVDDFSPPENTELLDNCVLLDVSTSVDRPSLRYIGKTLSDECQLTADTEHPQQVPDNSLLARLTDHYNEVLLARAPLGFEASFVNSRALQTVYRGILLPLSSDGHSINYVYGVISWREELSVDTLLNGFPNEETDILVDSSIDTDLNDELYYEAAVPTPQPQSGTLEQLLASAQQAAHAVQSSDGRTRSALYDALAKAFSFQAAAAEDPQTYTQLVTSHALQVSTRAPFTPTVKLVFGRDYDKTRLTEYAAALSFASREAIAPSSFRSWLEAFDGGLKGVVVAERQARAKAKGNSRIDKAALAKARLIDHLPLGEVSLPRTADDEGEFVLLVARRRPGSDVADILTKVPSTPQLLATALRRLPVT